MEFIILPIALIFFVIIFMLLRTFQIPSKIKKAEEFIEMGNFTKANEIIKKVFDNKKDYPPAKYLRAQILMKQNQYLLAISELNSILSTPDFSKFIKELEIHYNLAYLYNQTQSWHKEIEEYKMILKFKADDVKANHRIGHALYKQNKFKEVKEYLTKAIVLDPNLTDSYLPLGISCFKISDYENAEQYLTINLRKQGNSTEAQFYLGLIYKSKKDYENAMLLFDKSKTNKKYYIQSLHKIGEIFFELGQYSDAVNTMEKGLKNLKENTEEAYSYRYLLAECYENMNKISEAVHHWDKIHNQNPSYKNTRTKLESYNNIMNNKNIMAIFTSSLEELQPFISNLITSLHYNIISKIKTSQNMYQYKVYNLKRINDPPLLILFHRTTKEISEDQITNFQNAISEEKCKNGIYLTTSKYSLRAKSIASSKMIDLYDSVYINKFMDKSKSKKNSPQGKKE